MNAYSRDDFASLLRKLLQGEDGEDGFYLRLIDAVTVAADGTVTVRLRENPPLWDGEGDWEEFIFNRGEMWYDGEKRV